MQQPSTSKRNVSLDCDHPSDRKVKKRGQRIELEQSDEGSKLPVRAISTPEHHIGEVLFLMGFSFH